MTAPATVLLVDDEPGIRFGVGRFLAARGYRVVEAGSRAEALVRFAEARPHAAVLDHQLPDGDALSLLGRLHEIDPGLPVVVLTGHGSIELAVEAMRRGAEHFLTKPADLPALEAVLARCLARRREHRRQVARRARKERRRPDPFLGTSAAIRRLAGEAEKVAASDRPVLLLGETGSGKGLLARWLHEHGPRAEEPFVDLNCAGLGRELLESELFGHDKGAFTGAAQAKPGLLEVADRGTLFLDEIGDMPPAIQPRLLKVLEEQTFRRLGEVRDRRVDLRLLAATHHDLGRRVGEGLFREDLYYRVNTLVLTLPPLRRRRADIPPLAAHFLESVGAEVGRPGLELAPAALQALLAHPWPGNIRELRNVLERAVLLGEGTVLEAGDLRFQGGPAAPGRRPLNLAQVERDHIRQVLADEGGSVARAARLLGISRSTLYEKLKRYGLET